MSSKTKWISATKQDPCPICGHDSWCRMSPDRGTVACRRQPSEHAPSSYADGSQYWIHRIGPNGTIPNPGGHFASVKTPDTAGPDTLHAVYSALLCELELAPRHRANLRGRGLTDTEIDRREYRTLPGGTGEAWAMRDRVADTLYSQYGPDTLSVIPGLWFDAWERRWHVAGPYGLLVPVRDTAGRISALRIRLDAPERKQRGGYSAKYMWLSSRSRNGPKASVRCHVPLHDLGRPGTWETIRITEGELKADVATALQPNILTLGIDGVGQWARSLAALDALRLQPGVEVRLAYDADSQTNLMVATNQKAAFDGLTAAGYSVAIETWDNTYKGIDDYLAALASGGDAA